MANVRIILSALWVAVEFLYQQGDTQRLYSGDFRPEKLDLEGIMSPGTLWMISAITMTIPVIMIVLSLILPHKASRLANIVVAVFFFGYSLVGIGKYPGAYDRFLLAVSMAANALTVWFALRWV